MGKKEKLILLLAMLVLVLPVQPGALCLGAEADVTAQLDQADKLAEQGKFDEAEALYKQIAAANPGTEDGLAAQEKLVLLYIRLEKDVEAQGACDELLAEYGGHEKIIEVADRIFRAYRAKQSYAGAREVYKWAIENRPQAKNTDDRERALAMVTVLLVEQSGAEDVAGKLIADFSDGQSMAVATGRFGQACGRLGEYGVACELYERFLEQQPEDAWAVWAQMGVAAASLGLGDEQGMEEAIGELTSDFGDDAAAQKVAGPYGEFLRYLCELGSTDEDAVHGMIYKKLLRDFMAPRVEVVLDHIGDFYRDERRYRKAEEIFELVADTWRGEARAIEAQANIVRMYISIADEPNSARAFDALIGKFGADDRIAWAVWHVAERYWDFGSMAEAAEKYEYVVEHWPDAERAIWAKMRLVMARIKQRDYSTAEGKLGELLADYSGSEHLGAVVHEIVEEYRNSGAHEEGRELFNYLLEEWDGSDETMLELQVGVVLQSIRLRELGKAQGAIDRLIADYNEHPKIGKALFQIAEEYYRVARVVRADANAGNPEPYYVRGVDAWQMVMARDPNFALMAEAYYFCGHSLESVGRYREAIEFYETAADRWPDNKYAAGALYHMESCYYDLGRTDVMPMEEAWGEMKKICRRMLADYPDSRMTGHAVNLIGGPEKLEEEEEGGSK